MAWAPEYCTSAELKAYTRIDDNVDDAQIALAISAASRTVDRYANRQFGLVAAPEARYYTAEYDRDLCRWTVSIDDLMTVTGLLVNADLQDDGTYSDTIDEYALRPVNAAPKGRAWTRIVVHPTSTNRPNGKDAAVEVTARYGWTTVPDQVKQATLLQATRILERRNSPYGIAGSPDTGSELRLLAKLDVDVAVILGPYVRQWGAV
jgi:hypothetical protein